MRTISIYSRPYINVESDGIIYARPIHEADDDDPHYFLDGVRHDLTGEEVDELRRVWNNAISKS